MSAHISGSKLGASIHPEGGKNTGYKLLSLSRSQGEEISVVDFKANDMPGRFLPTMIVHR